jgi:hypothetical protein
MVRSEHKSFGLTELLHSIDRMFGIPCCDFLERILSMNCEIGKMLEWGCKFREESDESERYVFISFPALAPWKQKGTHVLNAPPLPTSLCLQSWHA